MAYPGAAAKDAEPLACFACLDVSDAAAQARLERALSEMAAAAQNLSPGKHRHFALRKFLLTGKTALPKVERLKYVLMS